MVYVCFDFGTKSWGVAVGDDISRTITPLPAVSAVKGEPRWEEIDQVLEDWQPEEMVIGYPLKASGERFKLTDQVDLAITRLKARYSLVLHTADERLTTVEAREHIFEKKGVRGLVKGVVDSESARFILQRWFEDIKGL